MIRNIYILLLLTFGLGQDYSLQFDGVNDYVELDTTNLNTSADFTVQFDVIDYGPNSNANHAWRVYFSNLGSGNPYAGIAVYSQVYSQYSQIGFFYNVPPNQISVVELPSDNSFNLAVSYNQSTIKFYLNGSLVYEDVATINYSEVNKFIIGSRPQYQSCDNECGLIGDCLNGNIDNFNFWNYELNQESIQSNIDNPVSTDDAGLVGSWNFNAGEGTILYDQSGNENHGTIQGNPEWLCNDIIDACGVCGGDDSSCSGCTHPNATNYDETANVDDGSCTYPDNGDYSLSFDTDYSWASNPENLVNLPIIMPNTNLTYELKFKTNIAEGGLFSGINGGQHCRELYLDNGYIKNRINGNINGIITITSENIGDCGDGEWHHVAITLGENGHRMFFDGNEVASSSDTYSTWTTQLYVYLGFAALDPLPYTFIGLIDDVRISNIERYNNGNPIDEEYYVDENTIGFWKFNAGDGDILYDHSGNANHGTINGAQWAGCTDENSCDYLPNAVIDDGSCVNYPDCAGVCFGDSYEDDCGTCDDDSSNDCFDYCLDLQEGANLKSFYALPEDVSISNIMSSVLGNATGVIGQGVAASYNETLGWIGSLSTLSCDAGYWITVVEPDSLCLSGAVPCDLDYCLEEGANLVSFPSPNCFEISDVFSDDIEDNISGIIGEGVAATNHPDLGWIGSLSSLCGTNGYWMIADSDFCFSWDVSTLGRINTALAPEKLNGYEFAQSTEQAFYFIESIENMEIGDWILSFNGDEVIGAREWAGEIIDVPAMGDDGSDYTDGYMEAGSVPQFKLLQDGELIDLDGDIPSWENNQLYMVESLTEAIPLPEAFSLDSAYPNPFNPVTTLNFAIPIDSEVSLSIYNLQGREITTLIDANMDAGYHSVVWNADAEASGVYFVKMMAGEYISTQKLMLIK